MRGAAALLAAAAAPRPAAAGADAGLPVAVEPWGENSVRVRVGPTTGAGIADGLPGALLAGGGSAGGGFRGAWSGAATVLSGNLRAELRDGTLAFSRVGDDAPLASCAAPRFAPSSSPAGYFAVNLTVAAAAPERVYGLGQLENTTKTRLCDVERPGAYPLARNGRTVELAARKFHVSIPLAVSSRGYAVLLNMPGQGHVDVGAAGGTAWHATHARQLDFWVTATGAGAPPGRVDDVYAQYARATGAAPPLPPGAALFWQSRLRYRNSTELEDVAARYAALGLPVGYFVVDFHNQRVDGDFRMNPACYPSVANLTARLRALTGAATMVSLWPEVKRASEGYAALHAAGCLSDAAWAVGVDVGHAVDPTTPQCRDLLWREYIRPNYVAGGVTSFWLDETDGEGTLGDGYDTACGPPQYCSRLWANDWIRTFSDGVAAEGATPPLVLTRGLWAGAQRHGAVLWSSDIQSSFESLAAQVGEGISASLSGVPWWTSDVGGFGCPASSHANDDPYMQELVVRWYQFGALCPIFRTHGCRKGRIPVAAGSPCTATAPIPPGWEGSCGGNEVWSYGPTVQPLLERYIRLRADLAPYVEELARNVSARGVPTMRPLWYEFPGDPAAARVEDQFLLGPRYLVAPVVAQGATSREVYFPAGASWRSYWDASEVHRGGAAAEVAAPLDTLPLYVRAGA